MPKPDRGITGVWKRFGHRFNNLDSRIFQHGDTTTKFDDVDRMLTYSHETGDIAPSMLMRECTDECQHGDIDPDVFRTRVRPDGLVEIIPPANKTDGEIEIYAMDAVQIPASQRASWPPSTQICNACSDFDFSVLYPGVVTLKENQDEWSRMRAALAAVDKHDSAILPFHKNFAELQESGKSCASCSVFLSALPDPDTFTSDNDRPIGLRVQGKSDYEFARSFSYLDVGFPAVDHRHPECKVTRYGQVDVIAAFDDMVADWPFGVAGRPVLPANEPSQALRWINDCKQHHDACNNNQMEQSLPTRLIRVPSDETIDPWLEDGDGRTGEYVALSYRWGDAKLSKTLHSNILDYKKRIPFVGLSKTIQHAIEMTRKLGYHWLWADCLCIIQDSEDDWKNEASQMAAVYQNATLTISGSVCESADSGLFYKDAEDYVVSLKTRTFEGTEMASFSITLRSCSSFEDDIDGGTLRDRGWCLQEHLLSKRILHFGSSQTHWECFEGAWSANYGPKLADDHARLRRDFLTKLPPSITKDGPASLLMPGTTMVKKKVFTSEERSMEPPSEPQPPLRQLYGHEPHGTWCRILMDYSVRRLTQPADKLIALAGLASAFAASTGDVYLNGLWLHGLPEGLLWGSNGLGRGRYEAVSRSKQLLEHRAPSWSWASLDGPIIYPSGKYSYIDAVVHAYSMPGSETSDCCTNPHKGALTRDSLQKLVLKVRALSLQDLKGFSPEERKILRENKDSRGAFLVPHAFWDDPEHDKDDLQDVLALFIAQVGCGMLKCDHRADCGAGFASCLLAKRDREGGRNVYRRVGIAQCYSGDFIGAPKYFITLV